MNATWSRSAIADLAEAREYIESDDPRAAAVLGHRILEAVSLLEERPRIGKIGRARGTREFVVADTPYLIIYRFRHGRLELLRVLHGRRLWPDE